MNIQQIIILAIAEAIVQRRPFTALTLSDGTVVDRTINAQ